MYAPSSVRAHRLVDMKCSSILCFAITLDHTELVWWPNDGWTDFSPTLDRYHTLYSSGLSMYQTICAALTDIPPLGHGYQPLVRDGDWHCVITDLQLNQPSHTMINIQAISWNTEVGFNVMVNGTIVGFMYNDESVPERYALLDTAPSPDQTFTAICTGSKSVCAVRTNGTIHCWTNHYAPVTNASDPSTGGAIHDDYISIVCTEDAYCAQRQNLDVYCWVTVFS